MGKIRVAVIGCGSVARRHIGRFLEDSDVTIAALDDIVQGQLDKIIDLCPALKGVPQFSDYREMLEKVELDGVLIATPHTLHFPQAMAALDAGLHVLLEKPMVCTVEDAEALIAKAREREKVLLVAYQRRVSPQFIYIREKILSGALGEVHFVSAFQCQNWKRATAGTWRQDPELSGGGQLNDSGSHLLDAVLWVTGFDVSSVSAVIDNRGTAVDIDSALSIKFTNGAQGSIAVVGDAPTWHEDISILGTEGALYYRNGKLFSCRNGEPLVEQTEWPEGSSVDENFIDAILGRDEVRGPGECGLRVAQLTNAAWESARTGSACSVTEA